MSRPFDTALPLLPSGLAGFFRRRLAEAAGLLLTAAAGALAAALLTYSPADPSFNNATSKAAANALGRPGAFAADLMLQAFGIAAMLPAVAFAAWGVALFAKRPLAWPWLRGACLAPTVALAAVAAGAWPAPESWPLLARMGGVLGGLGCDRLVALVRPLAGGWSRAAVGLGAAVLAAWAAAWLVGLGRSDLRRIADVALSLGRGSGRAFAWGRDTLTGAGAWIERIEPTLGRRRVAVDDHDGEMLEVPAAAEPRLPLVAPRPRRVAEGRRAEAERQRRLDLGGGAAYEGPPLDLLEAAPARGYGYAQSQDALEQNARLLATVLEDFGVRGKIVKIRPGPVVTLYELEPAPGTKTARVIGLADDIARSMSAVSVRAAVVPGRNVIGIELPNVSRETVLLRELLASEAFERAPGKLPLAFGKDIGGGPVIVDLARMPHLLIAGTTGSGKSVAINAMILSLLYRLSPEECRFIMVDPKMLELSVYDGIPHLLTPVVTDPRKAVVALKWTVREMEDRYRAMSQLGVRNIQGYNARVAEAKRRGESLTRRVQTGFDEEGRPVYEEHPLVMEALPFVVVVVDEMADLMITSGRDVEQSVQRLAQMARAAGIHIVMATQRPSVDVITGTIKANFPTRVSFQVTSRIDSRTILGEMGAEQLLGHGDMLYMAAGGRLIRVHGPLVADREVEAVVRHLKAQGAPAYVDEVTRDDEDEDAFAEEDEGAADELYEEALRLVLAEGKASTSFVQRHLQIGYNRAARIIERMEREGVVSEANRVGRREILGGAER
jgi:S-DNA-T family DNA segregation ATPase FtsK/SpoIIIE